jgi:hypothetical protein
MRKLPQGEGLRGTTDHPGAGKLLRSKKQQPATVTSLDSYREKHARKLATTAEAAGGLVHVHFVRAVDHIWLTPAQARLWADGIAQLADTAAEQGVDDV